MVTYKLHRLWNWYPLAAITFGGHIFVKDKFRDNAVLIEHECVHVRQMAAMGVVWYLIQYLLFLPLFWNPFRVRVEAEAYAVQARNGISAEWCAAQMSSWRYGWPCRKSTALRKINEFVERGQP